jgi:tRNA threonylcarbamoyladenosine modification (KEOPS) complex  Pcc1 subunit
LQYQYPSEREALIVCNALLADKEKRNELTKEIRFDGNVLHVRFEARHAIDLRRAATTFQDMLIMATRTLNVFAL